MKSCDNKLRNRKNLRLFLAGSALLLLASCSSAPAVLNNPFNVQNEVVKKVLPKLSTSQDGPTDPVFLILPYGDYPDVDGVVRSIGYSSNFSEYIVKGLGTVDDDGGTGVSVDDFIPYDPEGGNSYFEISLVDTELGEYSYYRLELNDGNHDFWVTFSGDANSSNSFSTHEISSLGITYSLNDLPVPLGVTFVHDIVDILVSGITSLGSALGQGISTTAQAMFINASNDGLSLWGVLVASFAGLALAVGITRLVFGFITSLGGKN